MDNNNTNKKKNPSRKECEAIIRKILSVEVERRTVNNTFRKPADFMKYFESLYIPSAALTKQVQRAIKSMNMAKDSNGYYILNKTKEQSDQDKELRNLFEEADYSINRLDNCQQIFIKLDPEYIDFILNKLSNSISVEKYIITMYKCYNGIVIITNDINTLYKLLDNTIK